MKLLQSSNAVKSQVKQAVAVGALVAGTLLVSASQAATTLTGAGSTFVYPILSKWSDAYQKATGVQINYQSIGSGGGIQQLKNHTVDFGASDAPLGNGDLPAFSGPIVQVPVIAGCAAIVYNVPGVSGLHLSGDTLAAIFMGQITRWNDPRIVGLNPGKRLPNRPIAVAHRSDGSGTTYIFTDYLSKVSPGWAHQIGKGKSVAWPVGIGGKGTEGVAGIVGQTPGSIGYVELAYAVQNHLSYALLRNRSGQFVAPSAASTTAAAVGAAKAIQQDVRSSIVNSPGAKAYPITGFTYVLLYKNEMHSAKGQQVVKFLKWVIGPGQRYAAPLLYAPLPRSVVTINTGKLR